jgi:hypothetical protein
MDRSKQDEPTSPTPIFVGTGPRVVKAAEFLLSLVDWSLREEEVSLLYPIEGELSNWIEKMCEKQVQFEKSDLPAKPNSVELEVLRESSALWSDPRNEDEKKVARMLGNNISLADVQRLATALNLRDVASIEAVRSEMVAKLDKQVTKDLTPALASAIASMVARGRAGRAWALCLVLHKTNAMVLINRARRGHAQAVLDLIKIDKLFLTDSCTTKVIRRAEFQNDRPFLKRLARVITYKPKIGWKKGCRLYLYMLFAMPEPLPPVAMLVHRIDPQGTKFRTHSAFERFVERCRADFDQIKTDVSRENQEEPKPR